MRGKGQIAEGDAQKLRTAVRALVRRFSVSERADVACCGLTVAQAAALEALQREGSLRLSDLGRRLGVVPSTLTRNLSRLESAGLVVREPDARDARAARVTLTEAGRKASERAEKQEEAFARSVLALVPRDRREAVVEALGDLLAAVRQATEACCPGAFDHLMEDFPRDRVPPEGCCGE